MNGRRGDTEKVSVASAEHYTWGHGCVGWHFVRSSGLSVIRERMPPGTAEICHRHVVAQQFFFVLSGVVVLEVAGTEHVLSPGEGIHVAAGVAHQMFNRSGGDAEFLVISQPPSHGDRELV